MTINADTKISAVLNQLPGALKVLAGINSRFAKLCNPFVRTLVTERLSLARVAKIGRCNVSDIYDRLIPLGFKIDNIMLPHIVKEHTPPAFLSRLKQGDTAGPNHVMVAGQDNLPFSRASETEVLKTWEELMFDYGDYIQTIDLRPLDITQTMSAILAELKFLHGKTAFLFLSHVRLPISFLIELEDKKFDYHIKVISEGEENILIFKR